MSVPESSVRVIGDDKCPIYSIGDQFKVVGKSLFTPAGKPACLILVGDITEILIRYESTSSSSRYVFDCSGCTGMIRMEYTKEQRHVSSDAQLRYSKELDALAVLLSKYAFFQSLDEDNIKELISLLKVARFSKGETVIKRGEPGKNLYIIVSGKVEVLGGGGVHIAFLEKGEIFGEMSLLSGDPVIATIKVIEPVTVLYLNGKDFRNVLNKFPSLQMYLARLLAKRLARTNVDRTDIASAMVGNLSEMSPSELFQAFNINHKTGVLSLALPRGMAEVAFRDGGLVRAEYMDKDGREAFFEILKEKDGRFKFLPGLSPEELEFPEIGDFMWLLMEGARRMDEECDCDKGLSGLLNDYD
ncbi:MAG: cyclic nucleotide-binding domain-containing protein [Desulfobacteraceae bacterium]|nr:cyclic nucleotide-binding domain-containing protein [Desulfobacteraceae bacterium]